MKNSTGAGSSRRQFLIKGGAVLASATAALAAAKLHAVAQTGSRTAEITPTEDLMREHGVLDRLMLIFDEVGSRLTKGADFPAQVLRDSTDLIRRFIQDYHEKNEEDHLFFPFLKAKKMVDLVNVLRVQHQAGRKLMADLQGQITPGNLQKPEGRARLAGQLAAFNRMYRPHAAWEDTMLFPAFRSVISPQEFTGLGDKFEEMETKLFGKDGFEKVVDQVGSLEKALGLYDLSQFSPK